MDLGLSQVETAERMGLQHWTILHWENHRAEPSASSWPAVLAFLGYDPYGDPTNTAELLHWLRRHNGEEIPACAERIGVSAGTLRRWEDGGPPTNARTRYLLRVFLAYERARLKLDDDFGTPRE